MFLSSVIEEVRTKEENNKAGCPLTFGEPCKYLYPLLTSENQPIGVYFLGWTKTFSKCKWRGMGDASEVMH